MKGQLCVLLSSCCKKYSILIFKVKLKFRKMEEHEKGRLSLRSISRLLRKVFRSFELTKLSEPLGDNEVYAVLII